MQKIAIICAFLVVIMAAILGLLIIFGMMSVEAGMMNLLKFGGAIVVVGVASALVSLMINSSNNDKN